MSQCGERLREVIRAPCARRAASPASEGVNKATDFGVAQQKGDLRQGDVGILKISHGKIMPETVKNLRKCDLGRRQSPTQRANAHAQCRCNSLKPHFTPRQKRRDGLLDHLPKVRRAICASRKDLIAVVDQYSVEPFVGGGKREREVISRKRNAIAPLAEANRAAEEFLKSLHILPTSMEKSHLDRLQRSSGQKPRGPDKMGGAELHSLLEVGGP